MSRVNEKLGLLFLRMIYILGEVVSKVFRVIYFPHGELCGKDLGKELYE